MGAPDLLKPPPHSTDAEQSVLGAMLTDNGAWDRVEGVLRESDFYRSEHRLIYRHVGLLVNRGKPADVITVAESLERAGSLRNVEGGMGYLTTLAANVPGSSNVRHYAQIVAGYAKRRELLALSAELGDMAHGREPVEQIIEQAQARVMAITDARDSGGPVLVDKPLTDAVEHIDMMFNRENPGEIIGIPSGLIDLDGLLSGFQPGELVIVAGRPSMGKSLIAAQFAKHVAKEVKQTAAVFSMEMPNLQLVLRFLAAEMQIDQQWLRTGKLKDSDWQRLTQAVQAIHGMPLYLDESSSLTVGQVASRLRTVKRKTGSLGLVVIDYLQLMTGEGDGRTQEIDSISRGLKHVARDFGCPVIALSQLNRSVESRPNKRPHLGDLRESGGLEADADVVIAVYRDEVYHKDTEWKGIAELLVLKQRNGPLGTVHVTCLLDQARVENFAGPLPKPKKAKGKREDLGAA